MTTNNGVLTDFSMNYTDTEFPSIENAMSKEDAENILFDAKDYSIVYMQNYTDNTREIIPVYTIDTENINPFTGKFVDYQNKEITENASSKLEYSDIDGHYAEKYIKELAYYGIGFEGGEFKPDEKITQKDFLALLMSINGNDIIVLKNNLEQANWVYRNSAQNSIISEDERDDDAEVTREEAAVYMIRAIGAENYAKYNRVTTTFSENPYLSKEKGRRALLQEMYNPNRREYPVVQDAEEIFDLCMDVFDPTIDEIFSVEDWRRTIENKECVIVRENGKIVTLYKWRIEGKKLYGNISVNLGAANLLYDLERSVFDEYWEKGIRTMYAWINCSNNKALKRGPGYEREIVKARNVLYDTIYKKQ